ncbi:hypothetical protein YC2023_110492 [Brassica napus]
MHLLKPNHADVAYVKDGVSRSTCDSYDDSHFADMSYMCQQITVSYVNLGYSKSQVIRR